MNKSSKLLVANLGNWEAFEILKYDKDHHFELHVDSGPTVPRTMSIIFMLNDDYEGGDLVFRWREDEMIIPKKANQLILRLSSPALSPSS